MPNKYQELIQERADLVKEAGGAIDAAMDRDGVLTAEEQIRDDEINGRLKVINDGLTTMDVQRERERQVSATTSAAIDHTMPVPQVGYVHTRPNTPSGGPYASLGHQMLDMRIAVLGGKDSAAAQERLAAVEPFHQELFADALGAGIAIDSDGGFLVQTDFASEIMRKMHDVGELLRRVRNIPLPADANGIKMPMVDESSRVDGSRLGGIRGYWVEEGEAPTATKPTFATLNLELHKVAALGYASEELLSHVSAMTAMFVDGFAEELRFKVEDAIFEGNGAGKPQGFTNANCVISVAKQSGQAANTVLHDNLKKMWAQSWARSRPNMIWLINQDVEPALDDLAKVIGTGGVEPNWVTYSPEGVLRIKGRPVVASEYCSTLGTVDDIVLVDLSQYFFVDRGGVQQAQSLHVRFTTDEMAFRATYRVDGGMSWKEALTPFKGTNTQSPVIVLDTRG